jgi:ATPase subunit of ABC transporter with duplicated ATPase domains
MASAKRDIRHIIDSFSEDLIEIAKDVVQAHVERAVSEWQAKNSKLLLRKSAEDEKALRNQKALERIERVAARRREREEKKATERALRLEQTVIENKKPRARRSSLPEATAKKEPVPPPLFVHKRRRDGEIEQLKRNDEPEPAALNASAQPAAAI